MDNLHFTDWVALIAALGVIVALISNVAVMLGRGQSKASEDGEIRADIKHIKEAVEKLEERFNAYPERLKAVEESAKQAHKRIDRIERQEH